MIDVCERCGMYEASLDDEWCNHCICEVEGILAEVEERDEPTNQLLRHYYTVEDLEHRIEEFEEEYGIPSEVLLKMWVEESKKPIDLPHHKRHVWLSFYREVMEHRGEWKRTDLN